MTPRLRKQAYFQLSGPDVLAIGPLGPSHSGLIVIEPDGNRRLAEVYPGQLRPE